MKGEGARKKRPHKENNEMYPPQGIIEIDGKRYEWRYNDCICGLYEVKEEDAQ
jgi:hypothetical protein